MDLAKRIRAVGELTARVDKKGRSICRVKCQGCGKDISSDENLSDVDYVKTKRGSEFFFHRKCADKVWNHGIV